ncbi:hypothetical protein F558DRAFT_00731 [Streptomyces sp. AmelKG-A3]|nr:hypothetical protein GA0115247_13059 [Streptomyces sp. PalvLS-984]SDB95634.1 hypothetical protein F558DRAFT_00731 [Streptomyces sp. AmelKG-A3]
MFRTRAVHTPLAEPVALSWAGARGLSRSRSRAPARPAAPTEATGMRHCRDGARSRPEPGADPERKQLPSPASCGNTPAPTP